MRLALIICTVVGSLYACITSTDTLQVYKGWNMISTSMRSAIVAGDYKILHWDGEYGEWKLATTLDYREGYYLYAEENATITINGCKKESADTASFPNFETAFRHLCNLPDADMASNCETIIKANCNINGVDIMSEDEEQCARDIAEKFGYYY